MINRCIGCYYHDNKENVCTHGSPIFIDDVCTDYQDSEFVIQIRAEVIEEILQLPKHNHYDMCDELMYQSISVDDIKQLKEKKNV